MRCVVGRKVSSSHREQAAIRSQIAELCGRSSIGSHRGLPRVHWAGERITGCLTLGGVQLGRAALRAGCLEGRHSLVVQDTNAPLPVNARCGQNAMEVRHGQ